MKVVFIKKKGFLNTLLTFKPIFKSKMLQDRDYLLSQALKFSKIKKYDRVQKGKHVLDNTHSIEMLPKKEDVHSVT